MLFDLDSKYFIQVSGGGYNKCILGNNSTNKERNRPSKYSCLPNCVAFVYGATLILSGKTEMPELPTCNAEDWNDMLKWERGTKPKYGAIACWRGGKKDWNSSDGCGHVAIVIDTYSDGSYLIAESGWTGFFYRETKIGANNYYGSAYQFECFLYNPYVKEPPKVEQKAKDDGFLPAKGYWKYGDKDERIGRLCKFYYDYFPAYAKTLGRDKKNLLGNLFWDNCLAWTKEFQKRTSNEAYQLLGNGQNKDKFVKNYADGNVGTQTYYMLKRYGFKG